MDKPIKAKLEPIKGLREDYYSLHSVVLVAVNRINDPNDNYFTQKAKRMQKDIDNATALIDQSISNFTRRFEIMSQREADISDGAKKTASKLKVASENVGQGIARLEKVANFDKLERLVSILERAADALEKLSDLEKLGKLEKIAEALK